VPAQLSPEQVRALLAGRGKPAGGEGTTKARQAARPYRVTWDRCAFCLERHQGLMPVRPAGPKGKVVYICNWCFLNSEQEEGIIPTVWNFKKH
jgi:hypothetical protein